MSDIVSAGIFILVLCIFYSRSFSKQALTLLSDEEKQRLAQKFSGFGILNQIPVVVVFAGYFALKYVNPSYSSLAFIALILFFLIFLGITTFFIFKKIKEIDLPEAYVKKYKQSRLLYNLGFTVCGVILLFEVIK